MTQDEVTIPASLLIKLFDASGGSRGENKGYILFFSNGDGVPTCVTNFSNTTVKLALNSYVENFVDKNDIAKLAVDLDDETNDND